MIVMDPARVLHRQCYPVSPGADVRELVEKLRAAMEWSAKQGRPAAGLAAPQIGTSSRVFVLTAYEHAFVNPRVVRASDESALGEEACLSLPKSVSVSVARAKWIKLQFATEDGGVRVLKMHGRDARAALHELDHLDGVLITDRGEPLPPKTYRRDVGVRLVVE